MTFSPRPLLDLRDLWVANGGEHLGIVGGPRHTSGYHLGRNRIFRTGGQGDRDYSIQLPRDRPFLTNAASAIDLGRLDGELTNLFDFSRWLVTRCQAEPEAHRDVREIIYSPDGRTVLRWDHHVRRSFVGGSGTGQGDDSHRTHTHISWHRDSQNRAKTQLFAPYFEEAAVRVPSPPTPQIVALPVGRTVFRPDGTTPLTTMSRATAGVYSPAPGPLSTQRYVVITTQGTRQIGVVNIAGLTFRPLVTDPATDTGPAVAARWEAWVGTRPR